MRLVYQRRGPCSCYTGIKFSGDCATRSRTHADRSQSPRWHISILCCTRREIVRQLADYAIARHYPAAREADNPYLAFFIAVARAQALLVAEWMSIGFIHGVMNTDNTTISGETIDYGPCAFMDVYDPDTVFSSIDLRGRYAYANQPSILTWNLARLAETLITLVDPNQDRAVVAKRWRQRGFWHVCRSLAGTYA